MTAPTLGNLDVSRAVVTIPRWGLTTIEATTIGDDDLAGQRITFAHRELELSCTVLDGGVQRQRGHWLCVVGAGKWSTSVGHRGYRNAAGVKLSTVVGDVAREIGEETGTLPTTQIGPAYDRREGEASRTLDLLAPENWYVDEAGKLQIGARAASSYSDEYVLVDRAPQGQLLEVRAPDWSALLPGAELEGIEVASVRHEIGERTRTLLWGKAEPMTDRLLGPFRRLVRAAMRPTDYYRLAEYKVSKVDTGYLDIRPMRTGVGLPELTNVPTRAGVPGGGGDPVVGSSVLVAFADGVPTRPMIVSYDGEAANGWKPTKSRLNATTLVEIGKDAASVEIAGGSQYVALANLVKSELQSIAAALVSHTHSGVQTGAGSSGGSNSTYSAGDPRASKTKAT
jgi:hypothetical protein